MPKTRRVAVLLGTDRQYHRGVLQGISRYARLHGPWDLESEPTYAAGEIPSRLLRSMDGAMLLVNSKRQIQTLRRWKLPVVNLSSQFPEEDLAHVSNDGTSIAVLAIEHFIERGFHNFAFCDLTDGSHIRRRRFEEQLNARRLTGQMFQVSHAERDDWIFGQDRLRLEKWLDKLPKPIGILAHNDIRGRHLVDACRRMGIAIPDDVAVLGVDNELPHCEMSNPPLSSIVTDAVRIGYEAGFLLDQLMNGRDPTPKRLLIPALGIVVRQSTDVTATTDQHVAKAVRYIRQHVGEEIDVGDILQHVGISRTALDKRFLKALGHTPHEEIRRIRLKRARELLAESDLKLEIIAERCGFRHGEYLGAVFRSEFGQTPGEFRAQQKIIAYKGNGT
jgi:LacI family transcriptional regulator